MEAAQSLGKHAAASQAAAPARVGDLYRRILSREPAADEVAAVLTYFESQRQRFAAGELNAASVTGAKGNSSPEQAAWILVARALMNLDEAITKG